MTPEEKRAERRAESIALGLSRAVQRFEAARLELSNAIFDLSLLVEALQPLPDYLRTNLLIARLELLVREIQGSHARLQTRYAEAAALTKQAVFTRELYPKGKSSS